ncbi:MAG: beta strand repeat-containing protein, partial [Burkholderiales bacterium]
MVSGNVVATAATDINLGSLNATGSLSATATAGDITQAAPVVIGGTTALNAPTGEVDLSNATNNFVGAVSLTAESAQIVDGVGGLRTGTVTTTAGDLVLASSGGGLSLGTTTVAGDAQVNSTGGSITQTGSLTASGAASFAASTLDQSNNAVPAAVTLSDAGNNFIGPVTIEQASAVTLVDSVGGIQLANVNDTGALSVTSTGGSITQAANSAINAGGATTLAATANGTPADITLSGTGNNFVGPVNVSAGDDVTLVDGTGGLTLGTVTTTGNLSPSALGGDLVMGTSSIGGSLTTTSTGTTDLGRATITGTGDVTATSGGDLNLGNLTMANPASDLNAVSTTGDITQTGPVAVGGGSNLSAVSGNVSLANASNAFGGEVGVSSIGATISDSTPLTLGN